MPDAASPGTGTGAAAARPEPEDGDAGLVQPGPVEGLTARPMMMIRKTGEIDLPEAIYTPLAMD